MVKEIKDSSFTEEVIESSVEKKVLVDFWAPWCGPCLAMAPILDDVAEELEESVKIVKINVDDNPQSAIEYGIRSIPTLILFKDKKVENIESGLKSKELLIEMLKK